MRVNSKPVVTNYVGKPTIIIKELLDRSGSMGYGRKPWPGTKYASSVDGINEEINLLKIDQTANYLLGVTEFDTRKIGTSYKEGMVLEDTIPLATIDKVGTFEGTGPHGGTPLYEAVAKTIQDILLTKKDGDRVLLKIFTDGGENASQNGWGYHEGGPKKLYDLIEKVKAENKFTITFIGTPEDTESVIRNLGIGRGNTYTHDNTAKGVKMSMMHSAGQTIAYAATIATTGADTVDNFFTKTVEDEK